MRLSLRRRAASVVDRVRIVLLLVTEEVRLVKQIREPSQRFLASPSMGTGKRKSGQLFFDALDELAFVFFSHRRYAPENPIKLGGVRWLANMTIKSSLFTKLWWR